MMDFGFGIIVKAYAVMLCGSASRVWSLAMEVFWKAICPFLMVALLVVPVYLVDIRLAMSLMATSDQSDDSWNPYAMTEKPNTTQGIVIAVIILPYIFRVAWIIPLSFCLWSHYWVAFELGNPVRRSHSST
ncbi:uncharacterized protein CC84DRAFT_1215668 [Paraphaeosphaeria sporulosa]|uniref:Uncharacterized protein n=1 Tax=Paraphaeosphaeria sporulosa TaxID=1460663 RepID=A0A177CIE3_9PLEO|nr:uncharacterized protein CC84DRAFT_1215668 [Paraphaeosphaeria sporulosa]OAG06619.1 hypothetical protein CC84DRAFT_1215668 [Paraphaeosphaeria sporulosa]